MAALIDPMARLYPTEEDSRRVVFDAGLDSGDIAFDKRAKNNWYEILQEARKSPGRIEAIVRTALNQYPDDESLTSALTVAAQQMVLEPALGAHPKVEPEEADELEGVEPERPLVDREDIVSRLLSELDEVTKSRTGQTLILVGDSGVGKSRLAERAYRVARDKGMVVLRAQCVGTGAEPLLPFRDCLGSVRLRRRLPSILSESSGDAQDSLRFLQSFLGIDAPTTSVSALGGSGDRGVYEGLAKVLLGLAGHRGLCMVVEDLTDADQDTLFFLEYFRRKASPDSVVTIFTAKKDLLDDQVRDLINKWKGDGCRVFDVPPLEPNDAARLVSAVWVGPSLSEGRVGQIVTLSGGNPFFIEQILSLVAENPAPDASLANVPPRVEAVLRRRLQRIDQATRDFLDAAAVALEAAHKVDLIAHVAGVEERTGLTLLRTACELDCLAEDVQGGISFAQELLRRVVYEDIGANSRRLMHGRAAEWLEQADLLASAAVHYELAGRTEELVRTAIDGAERAERGGMYRSALQLYERAQRYVDLDSIGARMAKAYIVVGEWTRADELLDQLPADAVEIRILRAELSFVRGDFTRALEEMELALQSPSADRVESLIQLGGIHLYLGQLGKAAEYANKALPDAAHPTALVRCEGLLGAAAFFGGDIDEGEQHFVDAMTVLSSQPIEERDRTVYTTILGNLGQANEVRGQWDAAKRLHQEALSVRRTASDARGELQSLHAVARSEVGLGSIERATALLGQARRLASDLGERLEGGKIDHTSAQVELLRGRAPAAIRLAEAALQRFRESQVAYDIAHARFTLASAFAASGALRRGVEEGGRARIEAERNGFGLLSRLFPGLAFSYRTRIEAGLSAYACGDALGLPWEGVPAEQVDATRILSVPTARSWPRGATSDDTALTLLVAEHLVASGRSEGSGFLELLAARAPTIDGLGPSTTEAIERFRRTGGPPTKGGSTNGALMRSLPIGWAMPLDRVQDRRTLTIELSRVTHPAPDACCAACVGSACAAWAIEGASPELLLDVAREEAAASAEACGADERIATTLSALAAGAWAPSRSGVTLDPCYTLASVLWCIREESSLPDALVTAVRIGGDTDTVAALVGGLLGCRLRPEQVRDQLPWNSDVRMPDDVLVGKLAGGLADLRSGRTDR